MIGNRRWLTALLAVPLAATALAITSASARPVKPDRTPGGLLPGGVRPAAQQSVPTCQDEHRCTIVKDTNSAVPSCTGYSSQTTAPTTISVLVRTGGQTGTYTITEVPFDQYLDNVLPDEWDASWDSDALKAGAVAIRSYAWYWATHFGGYLDGDRTECFDVTDDSLFQNYLPGTAMASTDTAIAQTRQVAARVNGNIVQTSYQSYLNNASENCGAGANGSVLSQVGTQACIDSDLHSGGNTGNKYNVILAKYYYPGLQLSTVRQQRTAHDFTFEQTSTRATFSAGTWSIDDGYGTRFSLGQSGDDPEITDNGDGFAHITVWRPSTGYWYVGTPDGLIASKTQWGQRGDIPIPGHYNGMGQPSVLTLFRPSTGTWYELGHPSIQYGQNGDIPVPGDYVDTTGTTGIALFRPASGTWYVRGRSGIQYGQRGDIPLPADYDGNGSTDIALYRPSTHMFYVRGQAGVHYGVTGDIPVTGDFTGDGKTDLALYRPSTHVWYVHGASSVAYGARGAAPIGAAPYRG